MCRLQHSGRYRFRAIFALPGGDTKRCVCCRLHLRGIIDCGAFLIAPAMARRRRRYAAPAVAPPSSSSRFRGKSLGTNPVLPSPPPSCSPIKYTLVNHLTRQIDVERYHLPSCSFNGIMFYYSGTKAGGART